MGIFDQSESVAEWVLDCGDSDSFANIRHRLENDPAQTYQASKFLIGIFDAPQRLRAGCPCLAIRYQAEFKATHSESDIEGLIEIRLLT